MFILAFSFFYFKQVDIRYACVINSDAHLHMSVVSSDVWPSVKHCGAD